MTGVGAIPTGLRPLGRSRFVFLPIFIRRKKDEALLIPLQKL